MIGIMALSGIVMVLAIFVTLNRVLDFRYVLGYATEIDVLFSICLIVVFSGTFYGLLSATFAGLTLALCLSLGRFFLGYKRKRIVRYGKRIGLATVTTAPKWRDKCDSIVSTQRGYLEMLRNFVMPKHTA